MAPAATVRELALQRVQLNRGGVAVVAAAGGMCGGPTPGPPRALPHTPTMSRLVCRRPAGGRAGALAMPSPTRPMTSSTAFTLSARTAPCTGAPWHTRALARSASRDDERDAQQVQSLADVLLDMVGPTRRAGNVEQFQQHPTQEVEVDLQAGLRVGHP